VSAIVEPVAVRKPLLRWIALPHARALVPLLALLCFAAEAAVFVPLAYLNRDEGWYALSGRLTYQGQVPYRDFPYFQMPLGPYLFGGMTSLSSSPIIAGRIMAAALGVVSICVVMRIGWRLNGMAAAGLAALLLLCSPEFIIASTTARTEAIAVPLVLVATLALLEPWRGIAGFAVAPGLLLLASGVRLSFLPFAGVALALCYWRARPTRRETIAGTVLLISAAAAAIGPALLAPPHRVIFDVWTSQAGRNWQFSASAPSMLAIAVQRIAFVRVPAGTFFIVTLPMLLLLFCAVDKWRGGWRPARIGFGGDHVANDLLLGAFALLCWLPFATFDHQEARYAVPSLALLAPAVADVCVNARRGLLGEAMRYAPPLLATLVIAYVAFQPPTLRDFLDSRDLPQNSNAASYIRSISSPDAQLVTLNPALALQSGRRLPPALVMGQFSFWPRKSTAFAARAGVVNVDLLAREMDDSRTQIIALDDYDLGLIATFRDENPAAPADTPWPMKLFPELAGQFDVVRVVPKFGQFGGSLYIMKRHAPDLR